MKATILQWNVWFREDPLRLADFLAGVDADIVCLQELTTTSPDNPDFDIPAYLAERLARHLVYEEAQRWVIRGQLHRTQGNAILSRYPIVSRRSAFVQVSEGFDPPYDGEGRLYLEADIDLGGQHLTAATTHLSFVRDFGTSERRDREGERLLNQIGSDRHGYVFTGDLNSLPDCPLITQIPARTGLVHAGPDYGAKTWTTKPFTHGGSADNRLDWRLDYVFASPDVRVVEARVLETDLSDHLPVLVTVEI